MTKPKDPGTPVTNPRAPQFEKAGLPNLSNVAARMRWARERKGYNSGELGVLAALSHATISRVEHRPDTKLEAITIFKLALLLDVDAEWLACGYQSPLECYSARGRKPRPELTEALAKRRARNPLVPRAAKARPPVQS